jgi:hypothetical protein
LQRLLGQEGFPDRHVSPSAVAVEVLFAQVQQGQADFPEAHPLTFTLDELDSLDPDERLVALSMCAKLAGHPTFARVLESSEKRLKDAWTAYEAYESQLRQALHPWLST